MSRNGILLAVLLAWLLLILPALSWGETSVFQPSFAKDEQKKETSSVLRQGNSSEFKGELDEAGVSQLKKTAILPQNENVTTGKNGNLSVCKNGCNLKSIQMAVYAAREGDKIIVHEGEYNGPIFLTKNLELVGLGNPTVNGCYYTNDYSLSISGFVGSYCALYMPDIDSVQPDGAIYWFLKGNQFKSNASDKEALKCYNKAVQLDPTFVLAFNKKALVLENLSRYKEAIDALDQAIAIDSNWSPLWHNKGVALYELNRYEEAVHAYDRAAELDPDAADTLNLKGNALHSLGRFEEALQSYNESIEINPQDEVVWVNKGETLRALGHSNEALLAKGVSLYIAGGYEGALEAYDEAIRINPQFAQAWYYRGNALFDWKRYSEAEKAYDAAIKINPGSSESWYKKGLALSMQERYGEAVIAYVQAVKTNSQYPKVQSKNKTDLYSSDSVQESAARALGDMRSPKALDSLLFALNDTNRSVRANVAHSLGEINDSRALDALDQALGDEDGSVKKQAAIAVAKLCGQPEMDTAREWNNKGTALYDSQDYEGAVGCFDLALALDPTDKIAWNNKGLALEGLEKYSMALACYEKALEIDGSYALAWQNKGYALKSLGKSAESEEAFARASQLGYNS
ncbi:MAG: tetratricopeptide repeat protein [Methanothrix sp.]|nr:MAG: tetratricopeptide repeat protein [Methanothrix sp.]